MPRNLPVKPDDVVGREREWGLLAEFLVDPDPAMRLPAIRRFSDAVAAHAGLRAGSLLLTDWRDVLPNALDVTARSERPLLVIDELPYLLQHSPEIPGLLQQFYDERQRGAVGGPGPRGGRPAVRPVRLPGQPGLLGDHGPAHRAEGARGSLPPGGGPPASGRRLRHPARPHPPRPGPRPSTCCARTRGSPGTRCTTTSSPRSRTAPPPPARSAPPRSPTRPPARNTRSTSSPSPPPSGPGLPARGSPSSARPRRPRLAGGPGSGADPYAARGAGVRRRRRRSRCTGSVRTWSRRPVGVVTYFLSACPLSTVAETGDDTEVRQVPRAGQGTSSQVWHGPSRRTSLCVCLGAGSVC
ncbi:hypothetical protein Saa2_01411 [Streptomyces acidiscabies]|nr:hypothetical protein Saa2_01411 [Streptomyces acidiscabies]